MKTSRRWLFTSLPALVALLVLAAPLGAETRRFGDIEVHYSVFASSFLQPEVAAAYGIVRARDRALLNVAVRGPAGALAAKIDGTRSDLIRKDALAFREVREDDAIYYLAEFGFVSAETLYFDLAITPAGATSALRLEFSQALHAD